MRQSLTQQREDQARKDLLRLIKKGDTVYTQLNHVSRSGMSRAISLKLIKDNRLLDITYSVGQLLGYKMHPTQDGLRVGGAGMDMGFAVVYNLSCALFCPGKYDHDAAYSLKQEWL